MKITEKEIKKFKKWGFKEYTPSRIEDCGRAWQYTLTKDVAFVIIRTYKIAMHGKVLETAEIARYSDIGGFSKKTLYYGFDDLDHFWQALILAVD